MKVGVAKKDLIIICFRRTFFPNSLTSSEIFMHFFTWLLILIFPLGLCASCCNDEDIKEWTLELRGAYYTPLSKAVRKIYCVQVFQSYKTFKAFNTEVYIEIHIRKIGNGCCVLVNKLPVQRRVSIRFIRGIVYYFQPH